MPRLRCLEHIDTDPAVFGAVQNQSHRGEDLIGNLPVDVDILCQKNMPAIKINLLLCFHRLILYPFHIPFQMRIEGGFKQRF